MVTIMRKIRTLAIISSAIALSACASMNESTQPQYPVDFKDRFPITIGNEAKEVSIFPVQHGRLDGAQRNVLIAYATAYKRSGQSVVTVSVPTAPDGRVTAPNAAHTKRVLDVLQANGVSRANIQGETYLPQDPTQLNPVKLSYLKPAARVNSKCGMWTDDVGFASIGTDIENLPYYNHGCATQAAVAAQIANPMDVVRHHPVSPSDAATSTAVLSAWRSNSARAAGGASGSASGAGAGAANANNTTR